jgi:hypothetical protein
MVFIKTRRSGLMKKNRHKKCHDTITLSQMAEGGDVPPTAKLQVVAVDRPP